jgi:hypothetical protein
MNRTIATPQERDALPDRTILLDPTGMVWISDSKDTRFPAEFVLAHGPATILWRPDIDMVEQAWDEGFYAATDVGLDRWLPGWDDISNPYRKG